MLIDTHCHLEMRQFARDGFAAVARAVEAGVLRMITVGTNMADNEKVIRIAGEHREVYCSVGIHPHDSAEATPDNLAELKELAKGPKVLAVGETGLDFFKNYAPRDVQIAGFEAQLQVAHELNMPIVIHDRNAHDEVLGILNNFGRTPYRGVFHCFSGDVSVARRALDLGFYISFTGTITYKNEMRSHEVLRMAPRDRVMVETDAPFLTPMPHRGRKRNEPAFVTFVAEKVAEIWGMKPEDVAELTTQNACRLFDFEAAARR